MAHQAMHMWKVLFLAEKSQMGQKNATLQLVSTGITINKYLNLKDHSKDNVMTAILTSFLWKVQMYNERYRHKLKAAHMR